MAEALPTVDIIKLREAVGGYPRQNWPQNIWEYTFPTAYLITSLKPFCKANG